MDTEINERDRKIAELNSEIQHKRDIVEQLEQKITKHLDRLYVLEAGINASVRALDVFKKIDSLFDSVLGTDIGCDAFFEFLDSIANYLRQINMTVKAIWMNHSATEEQQKQFVREAGGSSEDVLGDRNRIIVLGNVANQEV